MQLVRRILCIAFLALPPAAHAGGVVVVSSSGASGLWLALAVWIGLQPRPVPEVSPHHLRAGPAPAGDIEGLLPRETFGVGARRGAP